MLLIDPGCSRFSLLLTRLGILAKMLLRKEINGLLPGFQKCQKNLITSTQELLLLAVSQHLETPVLFAQADISLYVFGLYK